MDRGNNNRNIVFGDREKIARIPRGLQNVVEMIFEQAITLADSITGSREKSMKFLPIVLPLFTFILINNWLGIIPGSALSAF